MINSEIIINLYKKIFLIRHVEEKISTNYKKNLMRCPVHLSIGQEACAVGVCQNLNKKDLIISTHRAHAHYLAKGGNLYGLFSELHGNIDGCANGLGGSMHLQDEKAGVVASVPIVGSTIPIGVGLSLSNKNQNNNSVVVIFLGEGATEEGVFYESLNFAAIHKLKILFVCENNLYSVYTNLTKRQPSNRSLKKIVSGLGLEYESIEGQDVVKVYSKSKQIIKKIKTKSKPYFLELKTYRFIEHCGPNNDDNLNYRPLDEIKYWNNKCPLKIIEKKLFMLKNLNKKEISIIQNRIKTQIEKDFIKSEIIKDYNKTVIENINFS